MFGQIRLIDARVAQEKKERSGLVAGIWLA
jgi:hypothetical protein